MLVPKEIYTNWSSSFDTAKDLTRTLDYYTNIGVTTSNSSGAIKKIGTSAYHGGFVRLFITNECLSIMWMILEYVMEVSFNLIHLAFLWLSVLANL